MNNYSVSRIKFESLGRTDNGNKETFLINGKNYTADYNRDPQYREDNVLCEISYYDLLDEEGESISYILAYDKIEGISAEDINEWSDEYDSDNPYVLEFN